VDLVKGSITGSILANLLLIGGGSIVTGGIRFSQLRFNRLAASSSVSTLFLAVVAMAVPTLLSLSRTRGYDPALLSEEISAVLIACTRSRSGSGCARTASTWPPWTTGRPRRRRGRGEAPTPRLVRPGPAAGGRRRDRRGQRASVRRAQRRVTTLHLRRRSWAW